MINTNCPERGTSAGRVLPEANTEAMNLYLAEIERHVMPGSHAVVVQIRPVGRWPAQRFLIDGLDRHAERKENIRTGESSPPPDGTSLYIRRTGG
jgi:hypothetical protein